MSATVTHREIFDRLGSLERKVDVLIATSCCTDHEGRLRLLERWRYAVPPTLVLSIMGIVIGFLRLR